jgi:hypothetical protein
MKVKFFRSCDRCGKPIDDNNKDDMLCADCKPENKTKHMGKEIDFERFDHIMVLTICLPVTKYLAVRQHAETIYKIFTAVDYVFTASREDVVTNWSWEMWNKRWNYAKQA